MALFGLTPGGGYGWFGRPRPALRLFARLVDERVSAALQREYGLDEYEADVAVAKMREDVKDSEVVETAKRVGALGDGRILDLIERLADWVIENEEKLTKLVEVFKRLAALFIRV